MPRFLSPDWVDAFNEALAHAELTPAPGKDAGAGSSFRVAQVVLDAPLDLLALIGGPEGGGGAPRPLRTLLAVEEGKVTLAVLPSECVGEPGGANVSVVISYADAVALSRGELDPVVALGAGRVQIRGDLAVLVAGQALLASAAARLEGLHAATTY